MITRARESESAGFASTLGALAQLGWDMALSATDAAGGDAQERELAGLASVNRAAKECMS
jgi:hypothetical protein